MKTSLLFFPSMLLSGFLSAQVPEPPAAADAAAKVLREDVGISATDGISVSGKDVFVTRNGVSERLMKEMRLKDGTRVQPDGIIIYSDGKQLTLKVDQVLTFDSEIRETPPRVNAKPAPTAAANTGLANPAPVTGSPGTSATAVNAAAMQDGVVFQNGTAYLIRGGRAMIIDSTLIPPGQMMMNDGTLAAMPATLTDFPVARKGTDQQTRVREQSTPQPARKLNTTRGNGPARSGFRRE